MRKVISLDGDWLFRHETDTADRIAVVPLPWQAQFADLRQTSGRATYRRTFPRPEGAAVLRFGAVSYLAEVLVNGHSVGQHEGGYLPFDFAIPPEILQDINELEVRCLLPDGAPNDEGIAFAEIPHGKQSWYGPIGGIWQTVTLEVRDPVHLTHCRIVAQVSGRVHVTLSVPSPAIGAEAALVITGPLGKVVEARVKLTDTSVQAVLTVPSPQLWSADAPNL